MKYWGCPRKNHKKPHHPSKVQVMYCLAAKACGQWLPLLSVTLQGCTSFRHLPFHSVHCQQPASATHARVFPFIPLRSCLSSVSFRSPLTFLPTIQNSKPKREAPFHPPQFTTLHSVTTLAFPYPGVRMPCGRVCPGKPKATNAINPFYHVFHHDHYLCFYHYFEDYPDCLDCLHENA